MKFAIGDKMVDKNGNIKIIEKLSPNNLLFQNSGKLYKISEFLPLIEIGDKLVDKNGLVFTIDKIMGNCYYFKERGIPYTSQEIVSWFERYRPTTFKPGDRVQYAAHPQYYGTVVEVGRDVVSVRWDGTDTTMSAVYPVYTRMLKHVTQSRIVLTADHPYRPAPDDNELAAKIGWEILKWAGGKPHREKLKRIQSLSANPTPDTCAEIHRIVTELLNNG